MDSVQSQETTSYKKRSNNFRWTSSMSKYLQKCLMEQVSNGMKVDKSFKRPAFVATARAVSEKFKMNCSNSNVENHLRTLKTKYIAIKRLKDLSGVGWDNDKKMITMDEDAFNEYIHAHPKDEPYLNKPIELYEELVAICGDDQATGSFSRAMTDPMVDVEGIGISVNVDEVSAETTPSKSLDTQSTSQHVRGGKRKRELDLKFDHLANKIGELASAISKSRNRDISKELYAEVMGCKGYDEAELVKAFDHLLENEIQARSFLARSDALRQKCNLGGMEGLYWCLSKL